MEWHPYQQESGCLLQGQAQGGNANDQGGGYLPDAAVSYCFREPKCLITPYAAQTLQYDPHPCLGILSLLVASRPMGVVGLASHIDLQIRICLLRLTPVWFVP